MRQNQSLVICFKNVFFISLVFSTLLLSAQDNKMKKNAVYAEFGGNAIYFISINYEKLFYLQSEGKIQLGLRSGFSFDKTDFDSTKTYAIPFELNLLLGSKYDKRNKFYAEIGLGYTSFIGTSDLNSPNIPERINSNFYHMYSFRTGLRYVDGNMIYRIAFLEFMYPRTPGSNEYGFTGYAGFSFGFIF